MRKWLFILLSSQMFWNPISAQETGVFVVSADSVRKLSEVTIKSKIRHHETILPQILKGNELERVNAHNVADALRFMSGVTMKDYGGIGGLKTVNLRSMGSEHVGIYYDGIEMGNAQNGVIDLGQLSLDNIEEVSVYQGQRSAIMQTASDFANAGSIYLRTRKMTELSAINPQFSRIKLQFGSFGLARLSGLFEKRISERLKLNVNIEALSSSGHYDFRYRRVTNEGKEAYDTTANRQNGDIQALRGEANLAGKLSDNGHWEAKAYTYHSTRGIPGAIVNNVWRRGERQGDDNTWLQGLLQKDITDFYTLKAIAKYAHYGTHYQNRDTTQLMVDNLYRQQEGYFSLINVFELYPWWSMSVNIDERWNHLDADIVQFAHPTRWSTLTSIASAMDFDRLQIQTSLVYSKIVDKKKLTQDTRRIDNWTPALFFSYQISPTWTFSGFAKRSFRMPTFNDLYYTEIGNAFLQPEIALQYDLGINFHPTSYFSITSHIYHNAVHDKIVAYPKGQQFRWTMLNLGRVHIDGVDFSANYHTSITEDIVLNARINYTFQKARDVTDKNSSYYGHQIPYTPWHNGNTTIMLDWKCWNIAYNFVYTGERYCQQENIAYNHLQPWYTSDMHLSKLIKYRGTTMKAAIEVNNIFDQQYDVIINYPMPGRNFNLSLQCEF